MLLMSETDCSTNDELALLGEAGDDMAGTNGVYSEP